MSDNEKKQVDPVSADKTEDTVVFRAGIKQTNAAERKIKAAPVEHTSGNSEIRIPETTYDELPAESAAPRFIKTNKTPFVSVSSVKEPETETPDIDKYSDRLNIKAPGKKVHTGFTGRVNVYTATHSADSDEGRMIQSAAENAAPEKPAEDNTVPTREMTFDSSGKPEISNPADSAPTKQVEDPKGALLREIAGTAGDGVRMNPDQLMMEGFDSVGKKDEDAIAREQEELRSELNKARQKRISAFKFWDKQKSEDGTASADEKFTEAPEKKALPPFLQKISDRFSGLDTDFTPVDGEEYADYNERKDVIARLIAERKSILLKLLIIGVLGIALLITDIVASVSASANANGFFSVFGGSYTVFVTVNLAVLAVSAGLMARELKSGLFSLLKIHPKADTALLFLLLSVLAQNICAYFTQLKLEENIHLITPAAVLLCLPYLFAKLFYYDNIRQCFKTAAAKSEKSYLRRVSDEALVAELLRDREGSRQNVVYAGKTRFIKNFLARSADSAFAGMPSSRSVLITAAVSVAAALITAIIKQDAVYGVTALSLCLACSFPVSCLTACGHKIDSENKKLSVKSAFIQSQKDARDFSSVDNIAADASDLFSANITNCLTAKGVSDRQAEFCAAVLTSKFGGPLNSALMETAAGLEDKFPAAEDAVYEERLGLSAWVSGCKVLLGTHALLVNHNVQVPEESAVSAFLAEGETPVYLALEGRFAAVFGVRYTCLVNTEDLKQLVNSGTNLLISSSDANITEAFAEELLGLPECSVRVISSAASEKLGASKRAVTDSEEAGIVFGDSFESLCRCACAAVRLEHAKKTSKLICEAGAYVSLALGMILSFMGAFSGISAVLPLILQTIWLVLCLFAPLLFSHPAALSVNLKNVRFPEKRSAEKLPRTEEPAPAENAAETEEAAETPSAETPSGSKTDEPEAPAEERKEESEGNEEEDTPGHISQATYDALDALAGDARTAESVPEEAPETSGETEDELPAREAPERGFAAPDALGKAKSFVGGLLSRFTVKEEIVPEEEENTEAQTEEEPSAPRSFMASIPVRKQRRDDLEDENSVYRQAEEEARTRASFTPPEMPVAPHYDLTPKKPEPDPAAGSFVPPESDTVSYYSDAMFSRFEDDNIFAALHEEASVDASKLDF